MKPLSLIFCVFMVTGTLAEEKVKQDYSKTGLEGATKVEYNMPRIQRNRPYLNDSAYRFTLTPNYTIWPFRENQTWGESGISFGYVGVYDFYFGTKDSSPVISRMQNPLFYLFTEHPVQNFKIKIICGFGHESNGQFISNNKSHEFFEQAFADSIHGTNGSGDNPKYYQYNMEDFASVGWNYLYTEWVLRRSSVFGTNARLSINFHLRWFFKHGSFNPGNQNLDDNIFYDRELNGKTTIRDYDGFRYKIDWRGNSRHYNFWREYFLIYDPSFSFGLRHGNVRSGFHPTIRVKGYLKLLGSLPIFYRYDNGYGRDLSNYPVGFSSHAVGIEIGMN